MVTTIALFDDHRVVTHSLKAYLESFPDLRVVGIASSGEELLENLENWSPQVVLQDLLMPGGLDGIDITRRIVQRAPGVRIIALTASVDEARMIGVLRAGAAGYIRKDAEPEILLAAVRAVVQGRTFIDPSPGRHLARVDGEDDLTAREIEVLRQMRSAIRTRRSPQSWELAKRPSRHTSATCFQKLRVDNRGQATVQALKRGLVALEDLT